MVEPGSGGETATTSEVELELESESDLWDVGSTVVLMLEMEMHL